LGVPKSSRTAAEGIVIRHSQSCARRAGEGACDCRPGYQAQVYSPPDRRTIRKTFSSLTDARAWRAETQVALRRGTIRSPSRITLAEEAVRWLGAAKAGVIRNRAGYPYKPSALRSYEQALEAKVLPDLGHLKVSSINRNSVQDLVDRLSAAGLSPSTVRNSILPLRAIFRHLIRRSEVFVNPTLGLDLPAVRGRRERVARPSEARALLEALKPGDRPPWATALYAGLRRGELQALRWSDLDLQGGVIRVERSWDTKVGPIEPKSKAGRRRVPLGRELRQLLIARRLKCKASGEEELIFGSGEGRPLAPKGLAERARAAWEKAELEPIGLHECRHTYAAFMIAAGVNAKALSTYMGHSSITVTLDRYGHLMPGNEDEAATMLDEYLHREAGGGGGRGPRRR
jgi:integrase